jgi:cyclase
MLRIIGRLDIKNEYVIKGIQMDGLRKIGDSKTISKKLNNAGIDEIVYIDTVASLYSREKKLDQILEVSNQLNIPLTVAGGIRSLADAKSTLRSGADKIALNSQALRNPNLIGEIAEVFGSQCVVINIEAKKIGSSDWECFIDNGRERTFKSVFKWMEEIQIAGAGEVMISSVDTDGSQAGFDLELFKKVTPNLDIPWIAASGFGNIKHVDQLLDNFTPSGIAIGSAFHYEKISVEEIKKSVQKKNLEVRLDSNE